MWLQVHRWWSSLDTLLVRLRLDVKSSFINQALPWRAVQVYSGIRLEEWLQCAQKLQSDNSRMSWRLGQLRVQVQPLAQTRTRHVSNG